jgi:hypothetical protein
MNMRKAVKLLTLAAVVMSIVMSLSPGYAGSSGTITDAQRDPVDFLKHAQNSFRPGNVTNQEVSPYTTYQKACDSATIGCIDFFDIVNSSITTDNVNGTIKVELHTKGNVPKQGQPLPYDITQLPFTTGTYTFVFGTDAQDTPQKIGIACADIPDDFTNKDELTVGDPVPVGDTGVVLTYSDITPPPTGICPTASTADKEAKGIADGSKTAVRRDVKSIVHPLADGWLAVIAVEYQVIPCGADFCANYDVQFGDYEGYSGFQETQDLKDLMPSSEAKAGSVIGGADGKTVSVTLPYRPEVIGQADGDGYVDDARVFPWPFNKDSGTTKVTHFIAETSGIVQAGVNTVSQIKAVCFSDSANLIPEADEPFRGVGAAIGQQNKAVHDATKPIDQAAWDATKGSDPDDDPTTDPVNGVKHLLFDDPDTPGEQGQSVVALAQDVWFIGIGGKEGDYSQPDGFWIHGNGGNDPGDCTRGIYGLITVLDWSDGGFELRLYPRQPGYLPNVTNRGAAVINCRYPIGHFPAAPASVRVEQIPINGAGPSDPVLTDTSPFDKPWSAKVLANGSQVASQNGPTVANPSQGVYGSDQPCYYQLHKPGLHYFGILPDFTM